MERPLIADIVDLVAALFRAPPFSGSLAIYWDVVSGSGRASAPISLEPSCRHGASGWHRSKLCELPQILGGGRKQELVSRAARPPQSEATESEDAREMGEQHLDFLPAMTRTLISRRICQASGDIARIFVEVTRHFTLASEE